jgi:UDP-glucuronate 4-epimerase
MARKYKPDHLLMASTSSVYGSNKDMPLHETQKCDTPMSFYAATKKSNEAMAHSYSHLYEIPTTMFRFFTVYGPWGRPDMALFKFTKNILSGKSIEIYNKGNMVRDFTYIDDLVNSIFLLSSKIPSKANKRKDILNNDSISDIAPFRIVNIGNSQPINLLDYVKELENVLGKVAQKKFLDMQDGDIHKTHSNIDLLKALTGFEPKTNIHEGISQFVKWYKSYY